ncbi:MAG: hypothetical protein HY855_21740 [Burkholderiales bacterium]|nr:hypothetical protein [Burkholderiales bacterium]
MTAALRIAVLTDCRGRGPSDVRGRPDPRASYVGLLREQMARRHPDLQVSWRVRAKAAFAHELDPVLRQELLPWGPHILILDCPTSDFSQVPEAAAPPGAAVAPAPPPPGPGPAARLKARVKQAVQARWPQAWAELAFARQKLATCARALRAWRDGTLPRVSVAELRQSLAQSLRLCREQQVRHVVMVTPFLANGLAGPLLRYRLREIRAASLAAAAAEGALVCDLTRACARRRARLMARDFHFSSEAHRLQAQALLPVISALIDAGDGVPTGP